MVDAVLTWMDGNDPLLKAQKQNYYTGRKEYLLNDVAGPQRFVQEGEIFYAVASILRFAPFVSRIFIVSPLGQNPCLEEFIKKEFPDTRVRVEVLNQDVLFEGYEQYLPVFNSLAVETMLWRIPGLSEEFIYMNDDFFFTAPCSYEDLFRDGKLVLYSPKFPNIFAHILRFARRRRKDGRRRFTYKDSLLNSALAAGMGHYYHLPHEPHPLKKSLFENFYKSCPGAVLQNIRHRFRDNEQYNVQSLGYLLAEKAGVLDYRSSRGMCIKFQPDPKKKNYMARKLREAGGMENLRFGCMNDLRNAPDEEKRMFCEWLEGILGIGRLRIWN